MQRSTWGACGLVAAALTLTATPAWAGPRDLDAYSVKATSQNLKKLAQAGFDVGEGGDRAKGKLEVVGTQAQLRAAKVGATLITDAQGRSTVDRTDAGRSSRVARAASPTAGASDQAFTVWTKYDAFDEEAFNATVPEDEAIAVKEQYTEQYDRVVEEHPDLVAKRVTGTTDNGREIVALQVTKGATGSDIPDRPAVLYNAMQHAREWLAGETCRRTLDYVLDNYGKNTSAGRDVTPLVDQNELWFVCVNNPDGYEFTFTPDHRLWRKNLRDNDGDGVIAPGDGVDPNRNFSANWGRDDEGSSPDPADETYRGPGPASEPETKAMEALFAEIHPVFQKNDHTAAELLLYPQGFQQDTPTADNEIFAALAGDAFKPAIEGFLPELSAGLYITNGDFTDWAYSTQKTLSYTPEGTAAETGSVFVYPDSELQVGQEFQRHLPFIKDLARTADDPTNVESHLGNQARPIVVDDFPVSYGDPQPVQATLQRKLGPATLRFRVNGGPARQVPTEEWNGGERYYKNDAVYYHRVRGVISGTAVDDQVEAWFVAGGVESDHFTYKAQVESGNPVLLLADEDYSGKQPNPAPAAGPSYLDTYKDLLDKAGVKYDVYDIDAQGRKAPDELGVLKHYSHVVWYTGDDYLTRAPDGVAGSIDRLAVDVQNRVRDFLNEGGKLFYTGDNAGRQFAEGYPYNPFQEQEGAYCDQSEQCIPVQDDFLQYWLGANTYIAGGGTDENGDPLPVTGVEAPFGPGPYTLAPGTQPATFLVTSSIYDPVAYPQWADSRKALAYQRPGGSPFDPRTGDWFMSAGTANQSYRRLTKTIDLRGKTAAELSFWTSYDLEPDYDFLFVEARTPGGDDWTTLEEKNGLNSDDTGYSCEEGTDNGSSWQEDHPFLDHYQTVGADGTCTPTGTSGKWFAATGNSGGYKNWQLPLTAYAGKQVEISITVASDAAVAGLGTWVDDVAVTTNDRPAGNPLFATSFETEDLDGFVQAPAPEGTPVTDPKWERVPSAPFVESPGVTTPDTFYTGFGLEKVEGTENQVALLTDVFEHLGAPVKPVIAAQSSSPVPGGGVGVGNGNGPPGGTPPGQVNKPPKVKVLRLDRQRFSTARRLGALLYARCEGDCSLRVELRIDRRTADRYKLKSIIVGRATVTLKGEQGRRVRVKFTKTALQRTKGAERLRVQLVATAAGARSTTATTLR